ncbi:hypothetical protein [Nocardia amamiensis]|uniref:hypothetical protein n=1 Tax=Nocardia amamiensis TaxID=404578 RepID=UPI0033EDA777
MTRRGPRRSSQTERHATDRLTARRTVDAIHARLTRLVELYLLKPQWAEAITVIVEEMSTSFPATLTEALETLSEQSTDQLNMRDPLGTFIAALVTMHERAEAEKANWQLRQRQPINPDLQDRLMEAAKRAEWTNEIDEWALSLELAVWRQAALTRGADLDICSRHGVIEMPADAKICENCSCPLRLPARGRPPKFCCGACRQHAYRKRTRSHGLDIPSLLRGDPRWDRSQGFWGTGPGQWILPPGTEEIDAFSRGGWYFPDPARRLTPGWTQALHERARARSAEPGPTCGP